MRLYKVKLRQGGSLLDVSTDDNTNIIHQLEIHFASVEVPTIRAR